MPYFKRKLYFERAVLSYLFCIAISIVYNIAKNCELLIQAPIPDSPTNSYLRED